MAIRSPSEGTQRFHLVILLRHPHFAGQRRIVIISLTAPIASVRS